MIARSCVLLTLACALAGSANAQFVQQGGKLLGTGEVGNAELGNSVAVSSDGNTAIVGGPGDNGNAGAAWVYTRSGGVWTQQGGKLVGSGAVGGAYRAGRWRCRVTATRPSWVAPPATSPTLPPASERRGVHALGRRVDPAGQ